MAANHVVSPWVSCVARPLSRLAFGSFFIIAASLAAPLAAQPVKPSDEAPRDRSLVALRSVVIAAAKKRDIIALLRHVNPAATIDDSNAKGHAAWRNFLRRKPEFWDEIVWILKHGGKFGGRKDGGNRVFTAPYMAKLGIAVSDSHVVVVAANVPAYASPQRNSPVLATYSHELLKLEKWDKARLETPYYRSSGWVEIRTRENKPAFLEARFVRAVKDYQLRFEKAGDTWQIIYFLAGD